MNEEDINKIVTRASELKNKANSKVALFPIYIEAKNAYLEAYSECLISIEISEIQKEFISAIYLYESLDCEYAYELKQDHLEKCEEIRLKQKEIIEGVLKNIRLIRLKKIK